MESKFRICQTCTSYNERPPISFKIREYFEKFLLDNLFEKKGIIVRGKWTIILSMLFVDGGARHTLREVYMARGSRSVSSERTKIYQILLPLKTIQESKEPLLKTIELMYEAIKIFTTTTYKKVTPALMDELWQNVDLEYLFSLPYPAPLPEQKYVGDKIKPDDTIEIML